MKVIIVAGPTATGKTDIAITLAKNFDGELINADSRQVYKYLNIGTNKENITEVPMHLTNILDLNERFNLYNFQKLALEKINEISSKNKLPIIVGGTGLYLDSLIKGYKLNNTEDKRNSDLENLTVEEMQKMISIEVLESLNNSDKNNPRRLIRIIEKQENIQTEKIDLNIETFILYPEYDWENLKLRIDERVEKMFDNGLIEETQDLLKKGYSEDSAGLEIMGYREVVAYLKKQIDLQTCKERVKIAHKQYAKRQRTWFEGEGRAYSLNKYSNLDEALKLAKKFLDEV